jgi:sugar lactone lactonase YvrE
MGAANWMVVADLRDRLGESPVWHPGQRAIYWVDWYGPTLHRMARDGAVESWTIPGCMTLGSTVKATGGRMIVALDSGVKIFDPDSGHLTSLADPNQGRDGVSYNDGKLDRQGRLWLGTFDVNEREPRGILYCIDRDRSVHVADSGYVVCNGPAFSPDGAVLYFSDTMGRRIIAYDVDAHRPRLGNRRIFADLAAEAGLPDGLTVDADGHLWCALYGAGRLIRFTPQGRLQQTYHLPTPNVTSCAFGGPSLTRLFVTSGEDPAFRGKSGDTGTGGALFAADLGIRGLVECEFDPGSD